MLFNSSTRIFSLVILINVTFIFLLSNHFSDLLIENKTFTWVKIKITMNKEAWQIFFSFFYIYDILISNMYNTVVATQCKTVWWHTVLDKNNILTSLQTMSNTVDFVVFMTMDEIVEGVGYRQSDTTLIPK